MAYLMVKCQEREASIFFNVLSYISNVFPFVENYN